METSVLHQDQATARWTVIPESGHMAEREVRSRVKQGGLEGGWEGRFKITEVKGKWLLFLWILTIECKFTETFKEGATPGWEGSLGEKSYMYMYG